MVISEIYKKKIEKKIIWAQDATRLGPANGGPAMAVGVGDVVLLTHCHQ